MYKIIDNIAAHWSVYKLNKKLRKDVFKKRFYAKIIDSQYQNGTGYFRYKLFDRECPERNEEGDSWYNIFEITRSHRIWEDMNYFIVNSNF